MEFEEIIIKVTDCMKLKGFTRDTQKTYLNCIVNYLKFLKYKSDKAGLNSAKDYLLKLNLMKKDSNTIRVHAACLKFLLVEVLKLNIDKLDVPSPKRKKALPFVLSFQEVESILDKIENPIHNLMISFLYSTGIRLSELINMRRCDILFDRSQVFVKSGKGQKYRYTLFADNLKDRLAQHIANYDFKTKYLFESNRGSKYTKSTILKIVVNNSKFISNKVTPHTFRHSFATHLLETGNDICVIQKLLGHSNIETTMIYVKVANNFIKKVNSPFDML
jgi:site-specific recombinase XerD